MTVVIRLWRGPGKLTCATAYSCHWCSPSLSSCTRRWAPIFSSCTCPLPLASAPTGSYSCLPPPSSGGAAGSFTPGHGVKDRSEEHTSELQSHLNLVCRLLLEKKKKLSNTML